jgi:hypothetical protein
MLKRNRARATRVRAFLVAILTAALAAGCRTPSGERLYSGTPALLPGVVEEMNRPGFWVARHPNPDDPIMDYAGIEAFNAAAIGQKLVVGLVDYMPPTGDELRAQFGETRRWISGARVYTRGGHRVNASFMDPIVKRMAVDSVPGAITARYGFLARRTDLRVLPTDEPLYDGPGDFFIDNLQASSLEWGTPLACLHASLDGDWLFVQWELASGWIASSAFVETDQTTVTDYLARNDFFVVTAAKADVFEDEGMTRFLGSVRMATRLVPADARGQNAKAGDQNELAGNRDPDAKEGSRDPHEGPAMSMKISMPRSGGLGGHVEIDAWVSSRDVSRGYLPYTPRTVYEQSFKLLHTPYGWGGSFGERDCSQFLCEVFGTVGLRLPRNSSKQAKVGVPLIGLADYDDGSYKKRFISDAAFPSATLLRLPGHIMLYLGSVSGNPFVIHSTWAYREDGRLSDRVRLINRVVVSTLDLGEGSEKGSHARRLTNATMVITLPISNEAEAQN